MSEEWHMFRDKTLLITGGTGSFGNMAVRHLLDTDIGEIRIFSRDEYKQHAMLLSYNNPKLRFYIGDVRDPDSIKTPMRDVDYVFHAAALKHVPSCEFFPLEATKTNILGASNVLDAAVEAGVKAVICLSTDKAVYPINAMGISKAMMEKLAIAKSLTAIKSGCTICGTRYGNVMASRGSVIPVFVNQIKTGKKITITNPHMTRYLMSLDEAVGLVLFAFEHGAAGDIFVQKAPACTIRVLARALVKIFSPRLHVPERIIGPRHGEKLDETLLSCEEMERAEEIGDYFRVPVDARDPNYEQHHIPPEWWDRIGDRHGYTSENTERLNVAQVVKKLLALEYIQRELNKKGV